MGLDQYAYVAMQAGDSEKYWDDVSYDEDTDSFVSAAGLSKPREIAYWRKHPNLQGWMEALWLEKNPDILDDSGAVFNGVELELNWEDLDQLERAVNCRMLPETHGFFFGENSDEHYLKQDLEFIKLARAELFCGFKVFYNSSW